MSSNNKGRKLNPNIKPSTFIPRNIDIPITEAAT